MLQCIILAAGKGTRLKQPNITNKCLTIVGNQPLITYNLKNLDPRMFDEIIIIVGHNAQYLINYLGDTYNQIPIRYVYQEPQLGIAHGIKIAKSHIKQDFLMCLSDEILLDPKLKEMISLFYKQNYDCVCGMVPDITENIKKAYTMRLDALNNIQELIEKPQNVFNHFKGTGYCLMKNSMLNLLNSLHPNKIRGEYEMGDWIQLAIHNGLKCGAFEVGRKNFNINEPNDIIEAEEAMEEF